MTRDFNLVPYLSGEALKNSCTVLYLTSKKLFVFALKAFAFENDWETGGP